jgi:putative flippase GtrA
MSMQWIDRLFRVLPPETERFLRFAVVGSTGFVVDAGLLTTLYHGVGLDPFSARLISICFAVLTTWRLNRAHTFGASPRRQSSEGMRYASVAAATACFNYAVYCLIIALWRDVPPVAAAVAATLSAMTFSYLGYSRFAFHGATAPTKFVSARSQSR